LFCCLTSPLLAEICYLHIYCKFPSPPTISSSLPVAIFTESLIQLSLVLRSTLKARYTFFTHSRPPTRLLSIFSNPPASHRCSLLRLLTTTRRCMDLTRCSSDPNLPSCALPLAGDAVFLGVFVVLLLFSLYLFFSFFRVIVSLILCGLTLWWRLL
jgi:hypothetical protein